jgi:hypothetical protein
MLKRSSFQTAEELQEKVSIPTSTFKAVFEHCKSWLPRSTKQMEIILKNAAYQWST